MPYRIVLLSKFPPLEGGIASKTYWLARGLAQRNHDIHVITHPALAGNEYNIQGADSIPDNLAKLFIHRSSMELPWHLPEDNEYSLSILDHAIEVIKLNNIQIMDSGYLIPYGIIGNLVKRMTGVPHIVRHGGSDIEKFAKNRVLENLIKDTVMNADMVITDTDNKAYFKSMTDRVICQPRYVPDEHYFPSQLRKTPLNRLAFIGKINYYWQSKGLMHIAHIMRELSPEFECLVIGQGKGLLDFKTKLGDSIVKSLKWHQFVPPWDMPKLLKGLDAIFIFESFLPNTVFSNLALEALVSGLRIITDHTDFINTYSDITEIDPQQVLIISPTDYTGSTKMIRQWLYEKSNVTNRPQHIIGYQEYLSIIEQTYDVLVSNV